MYSWLERQPKGEDDSELTKGPKPAKRSRVNKRYRITSPKHNTCPHLHTYTANPTDEGVHQQSAVDPEGKDETAEEQDKDNEDQFDREMYADDDQGRDRPEFEPKSQDEDDAHTKALIPLWGLLLSLASLHSC